MPRLAAARGGRVPGTCPGRPAARPC